MVTLFQLRGVGITLVLENCGGSKWGGAMRSKPVFDPRSYHPRGLSFCPDPVGIVGMVTLFQLRGAQSVYRDNSCSREKVVYLCYTR